MAIDNSYIEHLKEAESILEHINSMMEQADNFDLSFNYDTEIIEQIISDLTDIKDKQEDLKNSSGLAGKYDAVLSELESYNTKLKNIATLENNISQIINDQTNAQTAYNNVFAALEAKRRLGLAISSLEQDNLNNAKLELDKLSNKKDIYEEQLNLLSISRDIEKSSLESHGQTIDQLNIILDQHNLYNDYANDYLQLIRNQKDELNKITQSITDQGKAIQLNSKRWANLKGGIKEAYGQVKSGIQTLIDSTKYWREQEGAIAKVSNTLSLSKQELGSYRQFVLDTTVSTQALYGISSEGLIKLQQGYDDVTGRAIKFNEEQFDAQAQLSTLMGENESVAFTTDIEKFGVGVSDARDLMGELYKTSKNQGITSTKSSQEFVKNLKIAQKYNFKGGLQNLKDMTVYAAKMRINLETVGEIADKISNPESAIQTAAKLQVLGGSFSSLANPLQMLYESLDDVGALSERVANMFDGMGSFNKQIGQVEFVGADRLKIKAASEALGMSIDEAMSVARERVKRNQIEQDVKFNTNLSDDEVDLLKTLAQFNKKNQTFEVSLQDERDGKFTSKSIAEIQPEDIKKLRGDDADIKEIAQNTFGINAKMDKLVGTYNAAKAVTQEKTFGNTTRDTLDKAINITTDNSDLIGTVSVGFDMIKTVLQLGFGLLIASNSLSALSKINVLGKNGVLGNSTIGKYGKGVMGRLPQVGKYALKGGLPAAAITAGIGGYTTYSDYQEQQKQRQNDIDSGLYTKGSEADKAKEKEISDNATKGTIKTAASTIGTVGGAVLGSILFGPGLGTMIGGTAGAYVGDLIGEKIGDYSVGQSTQTNPQNEVVMNDGIVSNKATAPVTEISTSQIPVSKPKTDVVMNDGIISKNETIPITEIPISKPKTDVVMNDGVVSKHEATPIGNTPTKETSIVNYPFDNIAMNDGIVSNKTVKPIGDVPISKPVTNLRSDDIAMNDGIISNKVIKPIGEVPVSKPVTNLKSDDISMNDGIISNKVIKPIGEVPVSKPVTNLKSDDITMNDGIVSPNKIKPLGGSINSVINNKNESNKVINMGNSPRSTSIRAASDDTAILAKTGGPFDKLFDNIIPRINNLHSLVNLNHQNMRNTDSLNSDIMLPTIIDYAGNEISNRIIKDSNSVFSNNQNYIKELHDSVLNNTIIGKELENTIIKTTPIGDVKPLVKETINKSDAKTSNIQNVSFTKPLEVRFNGSIKLESEGNKTIDLMGMIKKNPSLLKELTKMISDEMSATINGGRVLKEGQRNTNMSK